MLMWTSVHADVDSSTVLQLWKRFTVIFTPKNDKNEFPRLKLWTFFTDVPQMSRPRGEDLEEVPESADRQSYTLPDGPRTQAAMEQEGSSQTVFSNIWTLQSG